MGRVFKFHNDVDTDQIIASQYLLLPNIEEMKVYTFESIDKDFAKKVKEGDIVVAGENFGCGSSREQAPSVLKALGVKAVVAKSFARIFYRNSINIGLPLAFQAQRKSSVRLGRANAVFIRRIGKPRHGVRQGGIQKRRIRGAFQGILRFTQPRSVIGAAHAALFIPEQDHLGGEACTK